MAKKVISLDAARERVEDKYASVWVPVDGTEVELVNPIRLSEKARNELEGLQESMREEGADKRASIEKILRLVCRTKGQGDRLIKALDGDLALMVEVFQSYGEACQLGEASASED